MITGAIHFGALHEALTKGRQGDPESVLNAIDAYGWAGNLMINVGDVKGKYLDDAVIAAKPKVAVELGTFLGYGTIRIARLLPEGSRLITADPNAVSHAVSTALVKFAGLDDRVDVFYGYSHNLLKKLKSENVDIDFLFLDHLKDFYLSDFLLAEKLDLLSHNATVVGDNIKFPGCPEFKEHMKAHKNYDTVVHETFVEYSNYIQDEVTVSKRKNVLPTQKGPLSAQQIEDIADKHASDMGKSDSTISWKVVVSPIRKIFSLHWFGA